MKHTDRAFWEEMTRLAAIQNIVIDRPKGAPHPRYTEIIYPLDYGYIENTSASDGDGIDVWVGSIEYKMLTGILCTFDTLKRDAEIKLLLGCTEAEIQIILQFHAEGMACLFIKNPLEAS